jgi:hypothetical protein
VDTPGHTIDEALAIADQEWRTYGVTRRDRTALAAVIGYYGVLAAAQPMFAAAVGPPRDPNVPIQVPVVAYYGSAAAVVVACAVAAVLLRMRDVPRIRRTAAAMAVLLPLTGAAITPVVMGYAWTTNYSTARTVVLTDVAIILAALAGATVTARWWALRERDPEPPAPAEPAGHVATPDPA